MKIYEWHVQRFSRLRETQTYVSVPKMQSYHPTPRKKKRICKIEATRGTNWTDGSIGVISATAIKRTRNKTHFS